MFPNLANAPEFPELLPIRSPGLHRFMMQEQEDGMKRKRISRSRSGMCIVLLTVICMLAGGILSPCLAADDQKIRDAVTDTAAYLVQTVPAPQPGSIGGEWTVIGLAGSGYQLPSGYLENYYARVAESVKEQKGILHEKKYTEYSRLILALSAIGKNPADVGGYNLLTPLGDFDKTIWQGINGPVFALLALDSGNYEIPVNKSAAVQASREGYVAEILTRQCADGGFALTGTEADPDITAMALQALAKYQDQKAVKQAVEKALACLSGLQDNQGGYASWGTSNSESTAQVLMALCELGLDEQDSRFVKNGHSLADNLLTYYSKGSGFRHTQEERSSNAMATEQAFYALVNLVRVTEGQSSLYRMAENAETVSAQLFYDVTGHKNQQAIEQLTQRSIINGKTVTTFEPDAAMTRAEFAAIMTKGLNLATEKGGVFSDVQEKSWYAPYVNAAYSCGLIKGVTAKTFSPGADITREEAAVMIARGAALLGLQTVPDTESTAKVLAYLSDETSISPWARSAAAFCYQEGILSAESGIMNPKEKMKRGEIAEMLYQLLGKASLI